MKKQKKIGKVLMLTLCVLFNFFFMSSSQSIAEKKKYYLIGGAHITYDATTYYKYIAYDDQLRAIKHYKNGTFRYYSDKLKEILEKKDQVPFDIIGGIIFVAGYAFATWFDPYSNAALNLGENAYGLYLDIRNLTNLSRDEKYWKEKTEEASLRIYEMTREADRLHYDFISYARRYNTLIRVPGGNGGY